MEYVGNKLNSFVSKGKDDGPTAGAGNLLAVSNGNVTVGERSVREERLPSGAHVLGAPAADADVGAIRVGCSLDAAEVALGDAACHPSVAQQALWTWVTETWLGPRGMDPLYDGTKESKKRSRRPKRKGPNNQQ